MSKLGLKDLPITQRVDESLGIGDYADVLTEFIQNCDTPITIALQGDWGSGKTSLMNLIESELKNPHAGQAKVITIWFNTWQYAQFDLAGSLPLSMMLNLTSKLEKETNPNAENQERIKKFTNMLQRLGKAVVLGGASLVGLHDTVNVTVEKLQNQDQSDSDTASMLSKIKTEMEKIVVAAIDDSKKGAPQKIVVFVDDLDRIKPIRAVELLEAMKVFLDIDKCVYVLACDYGVVTSGLQEKFNWEEGDLKGKDFFDKIIQVPFKMPLKRYQPESYLTKLLHNTNLQFEKEDILICSKLIEFSVGFNPRSIKRVLNMLQLLVILDDRKRELSKTKHQLQERLTERRNSNRVMFGILCMLEVYEPIYDYIVADIPVRMNQIKNGLQNIREEEYNRLEQKIKDHRMPMATEFCNSFIQCIQLDDDESISKQEIEHLIELFSHTALVGHGSQLADFDELVFSTKVRSNLNQRYSDFLACKKPNYQKFRKYYNTVFLHLQWFDDLKLYLQGDESIFQFGLASASTSNDIHGLGEAMCSNWNWQTGGRFEEVDEVYYYWLVETSRDSPSAEEQFMDAVYERLDHVTNPVTALYTFIKEYLETSH